MSKPEKNGSWKVLLTGDHEKVQGFDLTIESWHKRFMKSYGIIGHPLGHTMSPALHNWGFVQCGINARYEAWPTPPDAMDAFMKGFREKSLGGLSVTIPHKRSIMDYLDGLTQRAQSVGAVNTLYWDKNRLMGENTDVLGITEPVRKRGLKPESALILGAGGAARAAVAACLELEIEQVSIANRTHSKGEAIAKDFGIKAIQWDERHLGGAGLLINSTPLGMSGDLESMSPWNHGFEKVQTVFDLVYNPLETRLLQKASKAGCQVIQGLEMFICQGLAQFKLWTGKELEYEGAKNLVLGELLK